MNRMIFIFLDQSRRQQRVCQVEHRKKQCKRAHSLPKGVLWSGLVPADRLGDFRSDLKLARRKFKNAVRRWETIRGSLIRCRQRSAPAFRAHAQGLIDKNEKRKPEFNFNWKP